MILDDEGAAVNVEVTNPETPFSGVQIFNAGSQQTSAGEEPETPIVVATDFLSLTDTPDSYDGKAGKLVAVNDEETELEFVTPGTSGGGGEGTDLGTIENGITALVIGQTYIDVFFSTAQINASWLLLECSILNNTDISPLNIITGILTSKTTAGFRLQLSLAPDSGNYGLHWAIMGAPTTEITETTRITSIGEVRVTTDGEIRITI